MPQLSPVLNIAAPAAFQIKKTFKISNNTCRYIVLTWIKKSGSEKIANPVIVSFSLPCSPSESHTGQSEYAGIVNNKLKKKRKESHLPL